MAFGGFKKTEVDADSGDENTLLPIMSLMLILIPVLVGNLAFFHFKSVQLSTPGLSESNDDEPPKATKNVIGQVDISSEAVKFTLLDEDSGETIREISSDPKNLKQMKENLTTLKDEYKKFDTLLVSSEPNVNYQALVTVLDQIKTPIATPIKTVIFNLVMIPKGAL